MPTRHTAAIVAILLTGCAQTPNLSEAPDSSRLRFMDVRLETACANFDCTEILAIAVMDSGSAQRFEWTWSLDDSITKGVHRNEIVLPVVDGLHTLEVHAVDYFGRKVSDSVAVSADKMSLASTGIITDLPGPPGVTILPLASCDRIPVTNISGCLYGGDPIEFDIDAVNGLRHTRFDATNADYLTNQVNAHAIWSVTTAANVAPYTYNYEYGAGNPYAVPAPAWADHFTFHFDANVPGTSRMRMSHDEGLGINGKVFAANAIEITCDAEGQITDIRRVKNRQSELNFTSHFYQPVVVAEREKRAF